MTLPAQRRSYVLVSLIVHVRREVEVAAEYNSHLA